MRKSTRALAVAATITTVLSLSAVAAQAQQPNASTSYGAYYIGVSGGVIIPQDLTASSVGISNGVAVNFNAKESFKTSAAGTVYGGYRYNDKLAAEVEMGFSSIDLDKITGTGTVGGVALNTGKADGHIDTFFGFVNGILTPFGRGAMTPYIGGGIGFAAFDATTNSITINGVKTAVNTTGSETDFAANALVGVDLAVTSQITIGGRYRFVWINSADTQNSGGLVSKQGDLTAHVLTVNATFRF
jgi:opacity protein-like surface antigen